MSSVELPNELIERLKAGDHEAVRPLWESYYPAMVKLARSRLRGTSQRVVDAEDVALSAFDSFCRGAAAGRFPSLDDPDNLWSLLLLITVRKAADLANYNRRLKRGGGTVRGDSAVKSSSDGGVNGFDRMPGKDDAPDVTAQLSEEFQGLLNRLEDSDLQSIAVWKMEGYSNAEVAKRLQCSEVTIQRRLRLIRKILQEER